MSDTLLILIWSAIGFLLGSIPFAWILARLVAHLDVRQVGDGNPGTANAWKAGGWPLGVAVMVLDFAKGFFPVGISHYLIGISGYALIPVALAPVLGHAFSPFLSFRGGKAVAVTFGIWSGLTLWLGPIALAFGLVLFMRLQTVDSWSVILAMGIMLVSLWIADYGLPFLLVWAGNLLVLVWKHRIELRQPPRWRQKPSHLGG
ncbi:MAG: glycerol-3-phosphate acyltransferase [bacterium]